MIRRRHITPLNEKGHNQELNCSAIFGRTIEGKNNKESHNIPNEKENEGGAFDDVNMSEDDEGGTRVGDIYIPPPVPPHCSTESKGARLIIKNIEVNNFKSFAGKVVLGPFHHRFTAIIGPNGSGKSNVIDSMLFVFGYRANRIRCKKISALLHKSSTYQNVTSCSVAVHFVQIVNEQDDTYEQVPNSDIVVQRTAFHDNSSFYTINGKRVQFKEVSSLLKEHSVDLDHNRFLILQGEVETIAEMKPKGQTELDCGMLEYLEDIIGTSRYKKPLMKINERVENLTEERTEKHNRCKLAERDMNDLEQPYNEAVEYLKQENENTRTKNLRIQKYLSETHKKLEKYIKDHEAIKEELSKHDAECEELKKQLEQYEKTIRKEMKHFENLQMKKEDIKTRMQMAKKGYAEVQQIMTKSNEVRKRNKNQLEKYEKELEELKKVPERNAKKIRDYEEATEHLEQQKVTLDEELEIAYKNFEEQTKPLIEKREGLENELIELTRCVDEAKSDLALTESELKFLTHETRKYESMKNAYEESQKTLQQHKLEKRKLEESLPAICKDIEQKTKDIEKLKLDKENMRTNLMTLKAEIHERTLSIQTTRSNNKVLDFIMQQKNEGKICGIIGRLGDLGAIDPKYDIAISSSCGRLDNILVETVDVAQKCIEHLKRYEVGRGCFIALDKVAHYGNESYPIRTPENVERLYDLVRVEDERVRPAFYFALRNTLIARDLEQARRIAYGEIRHRVVTLNGEVIETSGTMTGGGCIQIRGKMGSKVQVKSAKSSNTSCMSQKALENLQIKAEELQSAINFKEEEEGRLEKEIGQLTATAHQTECSLRKLIITINSLEEQLPEIFEQVEAQKERMQENKNVQNKVESLNCDIEKKKSTLLKAEEAANKMREKVTAVKNEIAAVHKTVKAVQVKIKNVEAKISETSNCIAQLKADINMSERNVSKKQSQIEQLQTSILNAQNKLKELSEARQKHDDDIGESTTELNKIEEEIQKAKSETSESYKGKQDIEKRKSDLNLKRVEIEHKLHTVVTKMQDVKTQIPHWQEELKPLKLNEIPGETEPPPPLKTYTEEELNTYTLQDLQYKESVQEELLKNKPNLSCIAEYTEKRDVYLERVKILEDITCKRNEMRQLYDDVRKKRYNEFMRGFHIITRKLKEMYQMITQGGDAELELVDSMDPFTEGVSFSVRPPKKTWKNISNLSGGEKTLSSLALVFALHYYKPSPLYFMDEIDAALDFKNISIVAHYIKQRTKNSQFIIISLRSNMFELSDYLVGIYKVNDCTDTCCIKNRKPVEAENNVITELMPTSQLPVQPQSQLRLQPQ